VYHHHGAQLHHPGLGVSYDAAVSRLGRISELADVVGYAGARVHFAGGWLLAINGSSISVRPVQATSAAISCRMRQSPPAPQLATSNTSAAPAGARGAPL